MRVENAMTPTAESSSLGTHQFLDEFALAYHRAVADRLRTDGSSVLAHARRNLDRWMRDGGHELGAAQALEEWRKLLDESDLDELIESITDTSDEGQRLRSSSPFAGALPPEQRLEMLAACEPKSRCLI